MNEEKYQKNQFIVLLREHLMSLYSTKNHFTPGEGLYRGEKTSNGYSLVVKDTDEPMDITGFFFRKDLCLSTPKNSSNVLKEIVNFASKKGLEATLKKESNSLKIKSLEDKDYLVTSHIDEGYAGEISVDFVESPGLNVSLLKQFYQEIF